MNSFKEIEGGILKNVTRSKATYVGMDHNDPPLEIMGASLEFDIGIFVIENPFEIVDSNNFVVTSKELIGLKIVSAFLTKTEIKLIFEKGFSLSVSLKDEDFIGPEAASYSPHKGDVIVFN